MSLKASAAPLALLVATCAIASCSPAAPEAADAPPAPQVTVTDLSCRPTPNGVDVTGCYATLTSTIDDRLVAVSSPEAAERQVHEVTTEGGVMRMRELPDGLALPAGTPVRLAPGGDHMMLLGLRHALNESEAVSLQLDFAEAPSLGARAVVAQPGTAHAH